MDPFTAIAMIIKAAQAAPGIIEAFKGLDPDSKEDQQKVNKWFNTGREELETKDWDEIK